MIERGEEEGGGDTHLLLVLQFFDGEGGGN